MKKRVGNIVIIGIYSCLKCVPDSFTDERYKIIFILLWDVEFIAGNMLEIHNNILKSKNIGDELKLKMNFVSKEDL